MKQYLAYIAIVVPDEAIQFYTQKLNFEFIGNSELKDGKR